jgi:hypothetical protein
VVIEATLTDRHGARISERAKLVDRTRRIEAGSVVRMNADGMKEIAGITRCNLRRITRGAEYVLRSAAGSDADDGARPRNAGGVVYLAAVAG